MFYIMHYFLTIPLYIRYADTYPALLPVFLCMYKRFRLPREMKTIFWLVLISGILNFTGNQIGKRGINNQWLYHLYAVITFCITSVYFINISRRTYIRRLIGIISVLFTLFSIINILLWQGLKDFDSNGFGIASILFIIYSILFYYGQLNKTDNLFIEKQADFWIINGIFFYYVGNLFLFLVYDNLINNKLSVLSSLPSGPWILHQIMFTIQMFCFTIGILLCKPKKQLLAA